MGSGDATAAGRRPRGAQAAEIASVLRGEIVSGALAPGTPLRQDAMARRFGVSRMPVREALHLLETQGLVDFPPNRSAVVAALSVADLADIFDMRAAAETLALRLALPHLTNARIDAAAAIQDRIETAPVGDFGRLNTAFHTTLYAPAGRPRLLAHISGLGDLADRYLRLAIDAMGHKAASDAEHRALLDACRARDAAAAGALLERHILRARDALAGYLAGDGPGDSPGTG